jgi:hypothetical protein
MMSLAILALLQSAPAAESWLPLAPGARWTYRTDVDESTEFIHEVTGVEKVGGVDCFTVEHRSAHPAFDAPRVLRKEWLASGEDGVRIHRLQRGRSLMEVEKPFFKIKRDLRKDDDWEGEARISENPPKFRTWVEDEAEVEVPAGRYKTRRLRFQVQAGERHTAEGFEWYARGVGLVKAEMTIRSSGEGTSFTSELKAYRPGGKPGEPERR